MSAEPTSSNPAVQPAPPLCPICHAGPAEIRWGGLAWYCAGCGHKVSIVVYPLEPHTNLPLFPKLHVAERNFWTAQCSVVKGRTANCPRCGNQVALEVRKCGRGLYTLCPEHGVITLAAR